MRISRRPILLLFASFLLWRGLCAAGDERPALVLVISVDQMRADYLDRFADLFGRGGFQRLTGAGAVFTSCRHGHASTVTGVGHSVILSGADPSTGGIVGNEWYDLARRAEVYCVGDSTVAGTGIAPREKRGRMSPRNFLGSTLGDELKKISPRSKILGIAIKDRSAILPAGHRGDAALWFDPNRGRWISSSYYMERLPDWLEALNNEAPAERFIGRTWDRLLPVNAYARCAPDSCPGEGVLPGETEPVFPHRVAAPTDGRRFGGVLSSPFGNEMTAAAARAALLGEQLGRRGVTDILFVGFSSTDYVGHTFGPESHEVLDAYLRLDRELASLFAFVDSLVGTGGSLLVLTSDHGACPLPELHRGGRRLSWNTFVAGLKRRTAERLGLRHDGTGLFLSFAGGAVYLDELACRVHGLTVPTAEAAVAAAALEQPGIARAFTRTQLLASVAAGTTTDTIQRRVERGFHPARSGSVILVTAPFALFAGAAGTSHGSPYDYDTHVPLLFAGAGVRPGRYGEPSEPTDIAPTLAALLGIRPGEGWTGRVLRQAITR